ncbi:16880_t:CDS:1, partial [Gigaspora margarita]
DPDQDNPNKAGPECTKCMQLNMANNYILNREAILLEQSDLPIDSP